MKKARQFFPANFPSKISKQQRKRKKQKINDQEMLFPILNCKNGCRTKLMTPTFLTLH